MERRVSAVDKELVVCSVKAKPSGVSKTGVLFSAGPVWVGTLETETSAGGGVWEGAKTSSAFSAWDTGSREGAGTRLGSFALAVSLELREQEQEQEMVLVLPCWKRQLNVLGRPCGWNRQRSGRWDSMNCCCDYGCCGTSWRIRRSWSRCRSGHRSSRSWIIYRQNINKKGIHK